MALTPLSSSSFVSDNPGAIADSEELAAASLWQKCLAQLKTKMPPTAYQLWFAPLLASRLAQSPDGYVLWCTATQKGKIATVLDLYQTLVESLATELQGASVQWVLTDEIVLSAASLDEAKSAPHQTYEPPLIELATPQGLNQEQGFLEAGGFMDPALNDPLIQGTGLNHRLTFDQFVRGKANQMAHAAAEHVADQPGTAYNPFFLYGGVGLGKTHLIHAIGNAVLKRKPNAKVRYIHANQFVADVVGAFRRKSFDAFERYYHSLDVLLIDDVQFFTNKPGTQEQFFYAFEALVANRSQIVLTSDTYPKDLAAFEARLISRFTAGLTTAIEPPELEMRVAILHEKAKTMGLHLDADVAFFIAKSLRSNVRELEGALHKLVAYSRFQGGHLGLELAKTALRDVIASPHNVLSVENIQKIVADYYKIKLTDLYGKRRLAGFVLPRQVAMYLAKELTQKSFPDIGESFGGRDHTTVLHAVRKIASERLNNPTLNHQIHVIEQTLRA